jgi:hypothetical protein
MVVVASAEPSVPVTCWAEATAPANATAQQRSASVLFTTDFKEGIIPLNLIGPSGMIGRGMEERTSIRRWSRL